MFFEKNTTLIIYIIIIYLLCILFQMVSLRTILLLKYFVVFHEYIRIIEQILRQGTSFLALNAT